MKKILLSLFIIIASLPSFGQFNVYHPFPDSSAYWGEESENDVGIIPEIADFGYKILGDTIVKGRTYHKLYQVGGLSNTSKYPPYIEFSGAIRSDSMKREFICCAANSQNDTLLYDFNLKVGDKIRQYNNLNYLDTDYVYGIDSILIDGSYRKQFIIALYHAGLHYIIDSIIEGIGSLEGLLEPILPPGGGYTNSKVLCSRQNGYVLYSQAGYFYGDTCIVFEPASVNNINSVTQSFIIYPNPANTSVTISYQLPQNEGKGVLRFYNATGQLITSRNINLGNGTIEEDVSALPGGVYYYTLSVNGVVMATNKLAIIR